MCVFEDTHIFIYMFVYIWERGSRKMGNVLKSLLTSKFRLANKVSFKRMYFVPFPLKTVVKSESSCNF